MHRRKPIKHTIGYFDRALSARAKRIYKTLFDEPWPKGWRFIWDAKWMLFTATEGAANSDMKVVMLSGALHNHNDLYTLVHEMIHVRYPKWKHGPRFHGLARRLTRIAEGVK